MTRNQTISLPRFLLHFECKRGLEGKQPSQTAGYNPGEEEWDWSGITMIANLAFDGGGLPIQKEPMGKKEERGEEKKMTNGGPKNCCRRGVKSNGKGG